MDAPKPLFSIVTSVYNHARFVDDRVSTIVNQTCRDWEWLIADDCSTDESYEYLLKVTAGDKRIRVTRNPENMGFARSCDALIRQCRGKYLYRVDSDDANASSFLEKMAKVLASDESLVFAACRAFYFNERGEMWGGVPRRKNYRLSSDEVFTRLVHGNFISAPTVVYRLDEVLRVGGFAALLLNNADWHLNLRMALAGNFSYIGDCLAYYRIHEGNLSASYAKEPSASVADREIFKPLEDVFERAERLSRRNLADLRPSSYKFGADLAWKGQVLAALRRNVNVSASTMAAYRQLIRNYIPGYEFPMGYGMRERLGAVTGKMLKSATKRKTVFF